MIPTNTANTGRVTKTLAWSRVKRTPAQAVDQEGGRASRKAITALLQAAACSTRN